MARIGIFVLAAGLALSACEEGTLADKPAGGEEAAPVARSATSVRLVERDVEAPQVFQVTDQALWDGRPSLGGVWVASPDAVDPERVILRNESNGKFVIGALFRRERLNPGPELQISSDAAAALGILAGQPTALNVTALRREEVADAPSPDASNPILDANEEVGTAAVASSEAKPDVEVTALAAIDRAEGMAPAVEPAAPAAATAPAAEEPAADAVATADPAPAPRRGWFLGKRRAAATAEVETAPLDPAGLATAKDPAAPVQATVLPAAATATPRSAAARAALIQIGIFSVEGNADRAVTMLTAKGVAARKLTEQSQGKTFWRVVADAADRTATLSQVKAAGFADAYPVTR